MADEPDIKAVIEQTRAALRKAAEDAERAKLYQLAFWPDDHRAMPGDFIACALFTASKVTSYVRRSQLASVNGMTVIFTGKRLTQVHADVWMGIMHLARERYANDVVSFRGRDLLELIGRHTHPAQREQLKSWISELAATDVLIQEDQRGKRFGGSLLPFRQEDDGIDEEDKRETLYHIDITRDLARVLSGHFWRINWALRKALQNKPLALWLQTYFARFARPVSVKQLHALSGSTAKLKMFRHHLRRALEDLHAAGGPSAGVDRQTDTVVIFKRPTVPRRPKVPEEQAALPFAPRGTLPRE